MNYHFGRTLNTYLRDKGITDSWLANRLGISSQAVKNYFKAESPRRPTVDKILQALEISEKEFYSFTNKELQEPQEEYKVKVIYKTKEELDFEKERREWEIRENEYLRQINELQQARIKELEEQSRA